MTQYSDMLLGKWGNMLDVHDENEFPIYESGERIMLIDEH
jgi:hypothetical protein